MRMRLIANHREILEAEIVDGFHVALDDEAGRRQWLAPQLLIRLVEMVAPGGAVPLASPRYRVMLGTITIEVDDSFRQDTLARLIATVSGC